MKGSVIRYIIDLCRAKVIRAKDSASSFAILQVKGYSQLLASRSPDEWQIDNDPTQSLGSISKPLNQLPARGQAAQMGPASGKECNLATRLPLPPAHPAPAHRDRQPLEKPATCLRSDARQCLRQSVLFYSQEPFVLTRDQHIFTSTKCSLRSSIRCIVPSLSRIPSTVTLPEASVRVTVMW